MAIRQTLALALMTASFIPSPAAAQADSYTCEGNVARVVTTIAGTQRGEWPINFRMNVDRAAGSVMIFAVSGTSVIKAGKHILAADQGRMAVSWNWTDQANQSQTVTMTIDRDGAFSGAWSESSPTAGTETILESILPGSGSMMRVTSKGTFSGICYQ